MTEIVAPAVDAPVAPTVEELQAQLAARDATIAETQVKLAKLENKDFNFNQVRKLAEMTEAERTALSAKDLEITQRQEFVETQMAELAKRQIDGHKADALNMFAGDDVELRKKMEHHYARIIDPATTREEISSKMREAFTLSTGRSAAPDAFRTAVAATGGYSVPQKAVEISGEQRDLAQRLGITDADLKAYETSKAR